VLNGVTIIICQFGNVAYSYYNHAYCEGYVSIVQDRNLLFSLNQTINFIETCTIIEMHYLIRLSFNLNLETCPPLDAPDNGEIDCSLGNDGVPTEGDYCTFKCDDGYQRRGNYLRRCIYIATWNVFKWTGVTARCKGMYYILL